MLSSVGLVPSLAASSCAVLPAPLGRADQPPSPSRTRRDALQIALRAWTVGAGAAIAGLVHGEAERLATAPRPDELREGDELYRLRSQNELAPRRAALDADWRELRRSPPTREQTRQAFEEVVRVRDAIREARALAEAQRWAELGALLPADTVPALERAATLLAASASLTADQRAAIGWQWGACGWRRCGAQADAAQALSKLRANLGMVVPLEALFYLDVALRATDEIVALGVESRLLPPSAAGAHADYLRRESLELILPAEDLASGDANLPVTRGGASEAEEALDELEAEILSQLSPAGLAGGGSDDT
ncbi:hypothetical protein EMIHUDRAFT_433951 [Emiliania huxleyi CCMP1516]|uniref:Uncharacterized protein n=2 Tax=Emiliania huxleyi TaxID=2903 RepID=A0A0D3KES5_EMIH1|nr:hypothetical protein EMIHUDRAFT_433951 [Emiliania huxleyi CCMP1516]EOD34260.1 hypothetical protein EMIHUDRAFT_433951 [Emiliania huxleyi CCMP1516]|eukprot:XP_005786689.1 hypothetical protein EMIHUDRAFT_433951 [Emiliania huxleyi CCMP1516]